MGLAESQPPDRMTELTAEWSQGVQARAYSENRTIDPLL